jgi:hypothetical protein
LHGLLRNELHTQADSISPVAWSLLLQCVEIENQKDQVELNKQNGAVSWTQLVKAGAIYFAIVFGAGFMLGTIRVLWLVPAVGTRTAELLEMPIMLTVIVLSARWVVRKGSGTICAQRPLGRSDKWFLTPWLGIGVIALGLILLLDFMVVLWIRGLSFSQYLEAFDPVAGTAHFVMLGLFAVMPLLVARREHSKVLEGVR